MPTMSALPTDVDSGSIAHRRRWWAAINAAYQLPERVLPSKASPTDPNAGPSRWMGKDNDVADRYSLARGVVLAMSERLRIPPENLVPPAAIRSLAWDPPGPVRRSTVDRRLSEYGARDWQRDLLAGPVAEALGSHLPRPIEPPDTEGVAD